MRFAIDACVPNQLLAALRVLGADVVSASDCPGMPDEEVLDGAFATDRVLITADKDFGELVFRFGQAAHGVVLLRLDIVSVEQAVETAARIIALDENGRGLFVVMDSGTVRARPMPARGK